MTSCFSPAYTTTTISHAHHPSTADRLGGFLAVLLASITHLASQLKPPHGGRTSPRKFVSKVSHKAMKMVQRRTNNNNNNRDIIPESSQTGKVDRDEALWQRAILMGDKCQPLNFSGVIYYDESGKQRSEPPPRSPRSPLPMYLHDR